MKNTANSIIIAAIVCVTIALSACIKNTNSSGVDDTFQKKSASKFVAVVDQMLQVYSNVEDVIADNQFSTAMAGMLATGVSSYNPAALTNDTLRKKIELLNLYKQTIKDYSLLSDENFLGKQNAFTTSCTAVSNCLAQIGDSICTTTAKQLNTYLLASRYEMNDVMTILINALKIIWNKDTKTWNMALNQSFEDFQVGIAGVSDNVFSEDKLSKYVYQPYDGKHALVEAYKLNLVKERYDGLRNFIRNEDNISSAIHYLACAYDEFRKKNVDEELIENYLERVKVLLDEKYTSSETNN